MFTTVPHKIADAEKMLDKINVERKPWSLPICPTESLLYDELESILFKIDIYKDLDVEEIKLIVKKAVQTIIDDEIKKYKKEIDIELNKQKKIIESFNKTHPTTIEEFIILHMAKERYHAIISIIENQIEYHIIKERFNDFPAKLNKYVIEIIDSFYCEEDYYY